MSDLQRPLGVPVPCPASPRICYPQHWAALASVGLRGPVSVTQTFHAAQLVVSGEEVVAIKLPMEGSGRPPFVLATNGQLALFPIKQLKQGPYSPSTKAVRNPAAMDRSKKLADFTHISKYKN